MSRRFANLALGMSIGGVLTVVFVVGFLAGTMFGRQQAGAALSSDRNLSDFLAAYHLVTQRSYYRPFDRHQLVYAAIDAMMAATGDPHTLFLSPSENASASQELNGAGFSGIGALVVPVHRELRILEPLPHTPSAQAGIHPGDIVLRIDGMPVSRMSGDAAISRIHGRAGTSVQLTVRRGHGKPFTVRVKRAQIPPITAYGRLLTHRIGYLDIMSFGDGTSREVTEALQMLQQDHARSIIVDLRDNPGGFVDAAQQIVSHFLRGGVVAYEKDSRGQLDPLKVVSTQPAVQVPVAVLVNAQTASAAEITAGALQDRDHAMLIGTRTYGKGSMQSVYSLADGSSIRITDRLWLTPHKRSIQGIGLRPNIQITISDQQYNAGQDPQFDAARRYLLKLTRS
ncbi:MAG: S41 family peptidase [Chloroflexota bacterium]|nr:S41 family peptidase [Chloroflexota bacterium]